MKNGANGINRSLFLNDHIAPNRHANISAIARPVGPHQRPPVAISFMSPIPIGLSAFGFFRSNILSKTIPIMVDIRYPNAIPMTPVFIPMGHGKNAVIMAPVIISGNKYASGIMRLRRSVLAIFQHKYSASVISRQKNDQNIYKNIFSPLRFESVL